MHRAAFLTFPFPGDKERLEIRSHSLAAAGAITRGHRGQREGPGGAGGVSGDSRTLEGMQGAAVGTGKSPSLQLRQHHQHHPSSSLLQQGSGV